MAQTEVDARQQALMKQAARQVSLLWWVPLLSGLVGVVLGLLILTTDWAVKGLVVLVGLLFLIHGIALVFSPAYARSTRGEQLIAGLVEVAAGIVLLAWPQPTFLVLAEFAGIWLVVAGGYHLVVSVARRHALPAWGLTAAVGVVELLLGLWVVRRPEVTLQLVVVVLGLWAVLVGVLECLLAFEVRRTVRGVAEVAAATTTEEDLAGVRDDVERLYAAGRLSGPQYAALTEALGPTRSEPTTPPATNVPPPATTTPQPATNAPSPATPAPPPATPQRLG